jgi:hypothetical protein
MEEKFGIPRLSGFPPRRDSRFRVEKFYSAAITGCLPSVGL